MAALTAMNIIENYKEKVKELGKDPNPGQKAIVVYGGYMGKTFHTHSALQEIGLSDCYTNDILAFNNFRKDWIFNIINNTRKELPIIVIDTYMFPYETCKKDVPEFDELVKSIPSGKFGFTLSEPFHYMNEAEHEEYTIPAGFYNINANLVFLIGYAKPNDLIGIIPSFDFNFDVKQLLTYVRENIDTIFPDFTSISHDDRLSLVDFLADAYEQGTYETLDFKGLTTAFFERNYYEDKKKENKTTESLDELLTNIIRKLKKK